ncbi:hypothetical protein SZMC14600_01357 [Saccharomonospora azurea SZMC 14600]|nr:hypothetical protein SZMC14600_01357 [Saccharomonospora azurea SZMC 14600]
MEIASVFRTERNKEEARPELGNTEVGSVQQCPFCDVTQLRQPVQYVLPVASEARHTQPSHILEQQCPRPHNSNLFNGPGKEVTLVVCPELLACDGEWGTRYATGEQGNAPVVGWIPHRWVSDITFRYLPAGAVGPECVARVFVELNRERMLEPGLLEP